MGEKNFTSLRILELPEKDRVKLGRAERKAPVFFPLPIALETVLLETEMRPHSQSVAPAVATLYAVSHPEPLEDHPENGKNFPFWKRAVLIVGDIFMYISVFVLITPIPLGWAMVPMSVFVVSLAVGRKHAERHLAKIVNEWKNTFWYGTFADKWMPHLLEKPLVKGSLDFLEVASRPLRRLAKDFVDTMKNGLLFAWELARPKKKGEKKEPATS